MARTKKSAEVTTTTTSPKKATTRSKSAAGTGAAVAEALVMPMSEEQVRQRAYELYLERRGTTGTPEEDWYRAESELRGKSA
jgi:hypothetical protein